MEGGGGRGAVWGGGEEGGGTGWGGQLSCFGVTAVCARLGGEGGRGEGGGAGQAA